MPENTEPAIVARGLTKRFGDFTAVDHIDFEVGAAEAFGFLGPNGAGKTSTMRMIGCASPVSEGTLRVAGMDPAASASEIKARLGVVPQINNLDNELSVSENLLMYARYFHIARSEARAKTQELLEFMQLSDRAKDKVEPLSGGMKRRLIIARALINDPSIILLDEPTTGLDPQARHLVWDRLYRLKQRGVTLVITTHYMDEAEQLCDRLVVMDKAKVVAEGTPRGLIERHVTKEVVELRIPDESRSSLNGFLETVARRVEHLPDRILLYADDGEHALSLIHSKGIAMQSALVRRASLEDVFLGLTGHTLVD